MSIMSLVEEKNIDNKNENVFEEVITHMTKLNLFSNNYKKPLLILGPSGVGKDTLINKLKEKYPNVFFNFHHILQEREDLEKKKELITSILIKKNSKNWNHKESYLELRSITTTFMPQIKAN